MVMEKQTSDGISVRNRLTDAQIQPSKAGALEVR